MSERKHFNHVLHICLSVITIGFWLPLYAVAFVLWRQREREAIQGPRITPKRTAEDKGYKEGYAFLRSAPYTLECNHIIQSRIPATSEKKFLNSKVYCDVCKEERRVMGRSRTLI